MLERFAADIEPDLLWVDELLTRFGRWSQPRRGARTCGSLEGNYRPPARGNDDPRRAPAQPGLTSAEAMAVHRTLQHLPAEHRTALGILYVPQRLPIQARLRIAKLTPRTCRELHAAGLRMFSVHYARHGLTAGMPLRHIMPAT